ncbi:hypothetical protein [Phenylobacterium sp.]|jgi:hypothetical protein|uniref:hypothetical protein n=1 Tax=Phenylobacterium sp. TaxID=1871053 RepID=UPI002F91F059
MTHPLPLADVEAATRRFIEDLAPARAHRVEAKVAGASGMPVLCAVEAGLAEALPERAAQELVWLTGAPADGVHRLTLCAWGDGNELLAQAAHEFAPGSAP